jgi:hypothetical protein
MTAHCRHDHWYPTERDMREAVEIWDIAHDASIPIEDALREIAHRVRDSRDYEETR